MFTEAIKYPFEGEKTADKLILGSLMIVGSFLIIPLFVLMGYMVRTVQNASEGETMPEFTDFKGLFMDGLKVTGIFIAYFLGLFLLLFVTVFAGELYEIAGLAFFWVTALYYFGIIYLMPAIIYRFSNNIEIRDAFQIREIVNLASTFQYLKVVLFLSVFYLVLTIMQMALIFTVVGILLVPATAFYGTVVYSKLIGDIEE